MLLIQIIMILILALLSILIPAQTLSGAAAASFCHCDLIPSFCDINCCCDSDCSATVSSECYNLKSLSYCPDSTFFSRIKSGYANSQGCFYYNTTSNIIEEVAPGTRQVLTIINQQYNINRQNKTNNPPKWVGYMQGDIIKINSNPNFFMIDSSGNCLLTSNSATSAFNLRFGVNLNLYCKCSGCSGSPQLYTSFSGKTINQFKDDTSKTITIPTINSASKSVVLKFIVGSYGTQRSKYIQRVIISQGPSSNDDIKLSIMFVQISQIANLSSNPSFFPQIPKDMFYPIFFMS